MSATTLIEAAERIRRGKPRVLDLFCGCGGLSLGFQTAGAKVLAGVEFEAVRARTHARNFHSTLSQALREAHGRGRDLRTLTPKELFHELELGPLEGTVDVIVGGPPCQAYARIGRAKLREIAKHPEAFMRDERGTLWQRYLLFVAQLRPLAVLMENVPDILSYGGNNVADEIASELSELGYDCRYTLLNAANYGVPQTRERWFLLGIRRELGVEPSFPNATHWFDVPVGYRGTRAHFTSMLGELPEEKERSLFPTRTWVCARPEVSPRLPQAVGCRDALGDLPVIGRDSPQRMRGPRDLAALQAWRFAPKNEYQSLMRTWPGYAPEEEGVSAHVIRALPRDYEIFARMEPGDDYPRAIRIAEALFQEQLRAASPRDRRDEDFVARLRGELVPPYNPATFPNRWRMLEPTRPARTLMAHLAHDSYSHIHYDRSQARTIAVREAARLQSFPDGFEFEGAMNAAFGQIGNAVPPLLARALATRLFELLRSSKVGTGHALSLTAAE